jgi:hypothetical protein
MASTPIVARATLLRLALVADCDERTIRKVLKDPSVAAKSRAARRALEQLKKAGLVAAA